MGRPSGTASPASSSQAQDQTRMFNTRRRRGRGLCSPTKATHCALKNMGVGEHLSASMNKSLLDEEARKSKGPPWESTHPFPSGPDETYGGKKAEPKLRLDLPIHADGRTPTQALTRLSEGRGRTLLGYGSGVGLAAQAPCRTKHRRATASAGHVNIPPSASKRLMTGAPPFA